MNQKHLFDPPARKWHQPIARLLWLAVQVKTESTNEPPYPLEILGVFSTEQEAIDACQEPTDCIGPLTLGEVQPREMTEWTGAYYPLATGSKP